MNAVAHGIRPLDSMELAQVGGGVQSESVYYSMGHQFGEWYYSARLATTDFYEWVANL